MFYCAKIMQQYMSLLPHRQRSITCARWVTTPGRTWQTSTHSSRPWRPIYRYPGFSPRRNSSLVYSGSPRLACSYGHTMMWVASIFNYRIDRPVEITSDAWQKMHEFTLCRDVQRHLGQSEDWIFWVSLFTRTCNVWHNELSRHFVRQRTSF